ncbi:hypothetical protein GCM10009639_03590 [Kitasatospora putterlickiae]|uniref:Uncharacterized protein n=1 Tax=Kitasatospora putterlickiae TaxID=221725 RepID=A0ABN1XJP9_9ACTN
MGVVIPLLNATTYVERTTVAYLSAEAAPDAAVQLRAAVDLDIHIGPGEELALALTHHQAEELLHSLAARLGHRVIGVRR